MAIEETTGAVDRSDWPATWKYHDRDRVRLLELLAEYGIGVNSSESVVFITGDHGDSHPYMDWRGEYGHGQPESSWWQQKVSVPLWMCLPNPLPASRSESGEATRSSQRDRSRVTAAYASAVRGVSEWYREPLQRLELQPRGANDAPLPVPVSSLGVANDPMRYSAKDDRALSALRAAAVGGSLPVAAGGGVVIPGLPHAACIRPVVSPSGLTPAVKGMKMATPGSSSKKRGLARSDGVDVSEAVPFALEGHGSSGGGGGPVPLAPIREFGAPRPWLAPPPVVGNKRLRLNASQ